MTKTTIMSAYHAGEVGCEVAGHDYLIGIPSLFAPDPESAWVKCEVSRHSGDSEEDCRKAFFHFYIRMWHALLGMDIEADKCGVPPQRIDYKKISRSSEGLTYA